jgi:molybdopterin/thiamine biosynthesis adenylyltransferase
MKSEILSNRELRIFKHQIDLSYIGIQGQEKLKRSNVLIVGAGGKGAFTLQNLAVAGIGSIGICDYQVVEETAIPRQTLYGSGDLGKQKAIISKQKLTENNPFCKCEIHNICLSENNISNIIADYDIIVDTTNNYDSHRLIDSAALQLNIPVVFGILYKGIIMVTVFHFKKGHSLQQIFTSDPYSQGDNGITLMPGVIIPYGLTGSILANEVLKVILDFPGVLDGKILNFDISNYRITVDSQ